LAPEIQTEEWQPLNIDQSSADMNTTSHDSSQTDDAKTISLVTSPDGSPRSQDRVVYIKGLSSEDLSNMSIYTVNGYNDMRDIEHRISRQLSDNRSLCSLYCCWNNTKIPWYRNQTKIANILTLLSSVLFVYKVSMTMALTETFAMTSLMCGCHVMAFEIGRAVCLICFVNRGKQLRKPSIVIGVSGLCIFVSVFLFASSPIVQLYNYAESPGYVQDNDVTNAHSLLHSEQGHISCNNTDCIKLDSAFENIHSQTLLNLSVGHSDHVLGVTKNIFTSIGDADPISTHPLKPSNVSFESLQNTNSTDTLRDCTDSWSNPYMDPIIILVLTFPSAILHGIADAVVRNQCIDDVERKCIFEDIKQRSLFYSGG
jgi:hypothetical protein